MLPRYAAKDDGKLFRLGAEDIPSRLGDVGSVVVCLPAPRKRDEKEKQKQGKTEGGFFLYFADSDGMNEIRECMDNNPEIDTTLFDACGEGFECTVENGILTGSITDLQEALY